MTHPQVPVARAESADLAVLLPGTGSDDAFVRSVFEAPLGTLGVRTLAVAPEPGPDIGRAYLAALDGASEGRTVLAGGVSFGAHVATEWALRNPDRCAGLLLALPAWNGDPGDSPAAVAARLGADAVCAGGVEAALRDVPQPWLAAELSRAWRGYGDGLAESLRAAAERPAPTLAELGKLDVAAGVAGCVDDQIHPLAVARDWAEAFGRGELCTTRLDIVGADPAALGRAAVLAWLRAGGRR